MGAKGLCFRCRKINIYQLVPFGPFEVDYGYGGSKKYVYGVNHPFEGPLNFDPPPFAIAKNIPELVESSLKCRFCQHILYTIGVALAYREGKVFRVTDFVDPTLYPCRGPIYITSMGGLIDGCLQLSRSGGIIGAPGLVIEPWRIYLKPIRDARKSPDRTPSVEPLGKTVLRQIEDWTRICERDHVSCRLKEQITWSTLPATVRLINVKPVADVSRLKLECIVDILGNSNKLATPRYAALSYKWADDENHLTTLENLNDRMQVGFSINILPPVIRDAVTICRKLGIGYLWVDSICIEQTLSDSATADFEQQVKVMDRIYAHAFYTIAASSSRDTRDGLLTLRRFARSDTTEVDIPVHFLEKRTLPGMTYALLASYFKIPHSWFKKTVPRITYQGESAPSWFQSIDTSILETRGWCFQERVLSKRRLCFTSHGLFWECRELQASELQPKGYPISFPNKWIQYRQNRDERYTQFMTSFIHYADNPFWARSQWSAIISEFTGRNLRNREDRLNALRGIAIEWKRQTRCPGRCLVGLWEHDLTGQLSWSISEKNRPAQRTPGMPSWSWATIPSGSVDLGYTVTLRMEDFVPHSSFRLLDTNAEDISLLAGDGRMTVDTAVELANQETSDQSSLPLPDGSLLVTGELARVPWSTLQTDDPFNRWGLPYSQQYAFEYDVESLLMEAETQTPFAICLRLHKYSNFAGGESVPRFVSLVLCPAWHLLQQQGNDQCRFATDKIYQRVGIFETKDETMYADSSLETIIMV